MDQSNAEEGTGCDENSVTRDENVVTRDTSVVNISVESERGIVTGLATSSVSSLTTEAASPGPRMNIFQTQSSLSPIISPWSSRAANVTRDNVTEPVLLWG